MGLLETIARIFRRETTKLDKRLQDIDPVGDAEVDLSDAREEANDFEHKIAEVMATTRDIRGKAEEAERQVAKYGELAKKAAVAENRADATKFVTEQGNHEKLAADWRAQVTKNDTLIVKLRSQLSACRNRISQAEVNQASLAARHTATKLRASAQAASGAFGNSSAFERLKAFETRVQHDENVAEAHEELADGSVIEAEARYEAPEVGSRVDALMAANAPAASA